MKTKYKGKQYTVSGIEHTTPEILHVQREDRHLLNKGSIKTSKADEISMELYLPYHDGWSVIFTTPVYSQNRGKLDAWNLHHFFSKR